MSQAYYRALIDEKPRVLAEIIRHNIRGRRAAVPSGGTVEGSVTVLSERSRQLSPALRAALERHPVLARKAFCPAPSPCVWRDFASPLERLALMPDEDLRRLALMTSAAVHGERLSKVVMRDDVLRMRAVLGDDLYRWALVRGRFFAGSLAVDLGALTEGLPLDEALPRLAVAVEQAMERAGTTGESTADSAAGSTGIEPRSLSIAPEMLRRLVQFYKKLILRELDASWTLFFD